MNNKGPNPFPLAIFACGDNLQLAEKIAKKLKINLGKTQIKEFPDGDFFRHQTETVRDRNIFVICQPRRGKEKFIDIFECITLVTSLRQGSPKSWITVVMPYLDLSRQDRKTSPRNINEPNREPVLAQLIPILLQSVGANQMIVLKLHNPVSCTNFPMIKMEDVDTISLIVKQIQKKFPDLNNFKIVAPDLGASKSVAKIAEYLGLKIAIINKDRNTQDGSIEVTDVIGKVKDFNLIVIDDIIDTAGTLSKGVIALKERGALSVHAICTHPVFSGNVIQNLGEAGFDSLTVTNSCFITPNQLSLIEEVKIKIEILDISELLSVVIYNLHNGNSTSTPMPKE